MHEVSLPTLHFLFTRDVNILIKHSYEGILSALISLHHFIHYLFCFRAIVINLWFFITSVVFNCACQTGAISYSLLWANALYLIILQR